MSKNVCDKLNNNTTALKSLLFTTVLTMLFVGGLILGEIAWDIERLSRITGGIATVTSVVFGVKILHIAYNRNNYMMIAAIFAVWLSEFSFSFGIFSQHVQDVLYNTSIILVMILLYRHELMNRDKKVDLKVIPKSEKKIIQEIKKWQ